jgi:phosphoribosylanthranilate isomerase
MTTRIKVCGLTRAEDVEACCGLDVELIGFNFWPRSKRYIAPKDAKPLRALLGPETRAVGVFVDRGVEEVARIVRDVGLDAVQLHGDEQPEDYRGVGAEIIQVVRMSNADSVPDRVAFPEIRSVLLDARTEGYGGSGQRFDWSLVRSAQRKLQRDVLLAGGLTPDNVHRAIEEAEPWGVDVASGVESSPGVKDAALLRAFVAAVRSAARELA